MERAEVGARIAYAASAVPTCDEALAVLVLPEAHRQATGHSTAHGDGHHRGGCRRRAVNSDR